MQNIDIDKLIDSLLENDRIRADVTKHKLSKEQIIEALPILIDMNQQDDEKDNFLISFYISTNGSIMRQETLSPKGMKASFLSNIVSQGFNPVNFEESKEYIKSNGRLEVVNEFIKFLDVDKQSKGLYIHGPMGVGKTFTIKRFAKKLAEKGKKVSIVNVSSLASHIKSNFGNPEKIDNLINLLKTTEYLFFDDIGAESISSWFRDEILFSILNYRMDHQITTFFTSNYSFADLEKQEAKTSNVKYKDIDKAKRLLERIRALSKEVKISGDNLRHK